MEDSSRRAVVQIGGTEIQKIEYRGQQVVTFAMIDKVHGRVDGTARRTLNENKTRFVEGEDFITLDQPNEIRTLGFVRPQGGTPASVVLITRRGYLKITKSLNDDKAWDVFDEMVERYFASERQKPTIDLNNPANLRALLLDNVEKVLALESMIEADKPKTSFYDAYINADGLYTLQNAARSMNCRPNLFVRWLKQKYMFYQGTALVPRIQYIQAGIFEVKSEIVDDKARPRSYITAKGLEYFTSRIPDEIKAGRAA